MNHFIPFILIISFILLNDYYHSQCVFDFYPILPRSSIECRLLSIFGVF